MAEREYDPATCITADELRAAGVPVDPKVPGCAWIRRSAIRCAMDEKQPESSEEDIANGVFRVGIAVSFDEPFRWLTVTFTVPDGGAA